MSNTVNLADEAQAQGRIDEEDIRLTTGFADIFTAVLLVAGGSILAAFGPPGAIVMAAFAWFLARPLVEKRRFAASGNALAVGLALGTGMAVAGMLSISSLFVAAVASAVFWWRARIPLSLALAWTCMAAYAVWIAGSAGELVVNAKVWAETPNLLVPLGAVLFAAAMWHDTRDRLRQSRQSDIAFWLHLISAPLFVHGLFQALGANPFDSDETRPIVVFVTFGVLTVVSLLIDRRPLLASSFVYLVAAAASLVGDAYRAQSVSAGAVEQLTAPALIGIALLFLAAGWSRLRAMLVGCLPGQLAALLPPASPHSPPPARDDYADTPPAETEPVRLVLGFNDLFVALGTAALFFGMIFVGIAIVANLPLGEPDTMPIRRNVGVAWIPILLPAAAMWAVAEYFVRVRRMAWPAITSAIGFWLAALAAGIAASVQIAVRQGLSDGPGRRLDYEPMTPLLALTAIGLACAIGLLANLAFWRLHRLPISFALAVAALLPLAYADVIFNALTGSDGETAGVSWQWRNLAFGLLTFGLALAWDRMDPERRSQRSDTAFWLHLLAALLVVPAIGIPLLRVDYGPVAFLSGYAALICLALVIDRRAPLVVGLPFVAYALSALFDSKMATLANLAIISGLLLLAYRWEQTRRRVFAILR